MASYKAPDFSERVEAANRAKQKALKQLEARPVMDEAEIERRKAARLVKEAAAAEKRQARLDEQAQRKADAIAKKEAAAQSKAAVKPKLSEAEAKAMRDARYAERKKRGR